MSGCFAQFWLPVLVLVCNKRKKKTNDFKAAYFFILRRDISGRFVHMNSITLKKATYPHKREL